MAEHSVFLLLTLGVVTCDYPGISQTATGPLALECVTVRSGGDQQSVYLVVRIGTSFERALDPAHPVVKSIDAGSGVFVYKFETPSDGAGTSTSFTVRLPPPGSDVHAQADVDTFDSILAQYLNFQSPAAASGPAPPEFYPHIDSKTGKLEGPHADELRGHLVLVNEDSGQIIGELDKEFKIKEDDSLAKADGGVVIELPKDGELGTASAYDLTDKEKGWLVRGATLIGQAIEGTSHALAKGVGAASDYYIAHSKPHASASPTALSPTGEPEKAVEPPKLVMLLTSPGAKKGIQSVHAVTGTAVQVSHKTLAVIDNLIGRTVGSKKSTQSSTTLAPDSKVPPPLPARTPSPAPTKSATAPPDLSSAPGAAPPLPPRKPPGMRAKILISADLVVSALENSLTHLGTSTTSSIAKAVGHKYGDKAAESTMLLAGTAGNIGLVYVDVRGVGRRAILKRAGKEFVKGRMATT